MSLRLEPDLIAKIDSVQDLYITTMKPRSGFSVGPMKGVTRADIVRWALEEGLGAIEASLLKKEGKR